VLKTQQSLYSSYGSLLVQSSFGQIMTSTYLLHFFTGSTSIYLILTAKLNQALHFHFPNPWDDDFWNL
jgi:hypothetical protein